MKLKSILFFNASIFLFAIASLFVTIANNNPYGSNLNIYCTFYISFFVTIWAFLTLLIFFLKSRLTSQITFISYIPTIRQAFFLSFALAVMLLLEGLKIFDWWVGISVLLALSLLELFFESKAKKNK